MIMAEIKIARTLGENFKFFLGKILSDPFFYPDPADGDRAILGWLGKGCRH
jgi:hypothetical protein